MGLLLRVARAKVGFLVDVASADIAVMGRVRDIRRERIGVIDRHGGVKRGTVYMIDERGDDVRPMEVVGGCADVKGRMVCVGSATSTTPPSNVRGWFPWLALAWACVPHQRRRKSDQGTDPVSQASENFPKRRAWNIKR